MKSKFWNYVFYNYLRKVRSKAFIGFNIFLIIIGLAVSQLGDIMNFFNEKFDYSQSVLVIDETNQIYEQFEKDFKAMLPDVSIALSHDSEEELNQLVEEGEITSYFILDYDEENLLSATYVANDFSNNSIYTMGEQILSGYNTKLVMDAANLTDEQTELIQKPFSMNLIALDEAAQSPEESMGNMAIAYVALILIFLFSYIYSVYAGQEIMEEKTSRVMEIIITSISPLKQLYGKIVYNTLYALTQLIIFMLLSAVSIRSMMQGLSGEMKEMLSLVISTDKIPMIMYLVLFAMIAYLIYLVSVLILSSIISSIEEYQIAISPIMILGVFSFYIGMFGMSSPESPFIKAMSMIPFISPYIMPLRIATMTVSMPMVWLSIGLNILVIIVIVAIGARVYKNGVLNYSGDSVIKKLTQAVKKS